MRWYKNLKRELLTKGGVHPPSNKIAATMKIFPGPNPESVVIPLQQHIGALCEPTVELHDRVTVGQKIGDSEAYVSAPVHSSVSGEVTGILSYPHPTGTEVLSIQIVSDGLGEIHPDIKPPGDPFGMPPEQIRQLVREAGMVGLGGATFPTHVKLAPPRDKPIDTVILNGAECEPYLTGDHRLMIERTEPILKGGLIIKRAVGAQDVVIAIERNKHDAITTMRSVGHDLGIKVAVLPARYPQGAEKTLVKGIIGKEVPSGGLPMDVGVIVSNVGTAAAIFDAFDTGMPLVERVLTAAGDGLAGHANLRVKLGTRISDVIEFCGGLVGEKGKLVLGGPMMGLAQHTTSVPVIKGTSGIIALRGETVWQQEPSHFVCIRCGRCVRRCPMNLMPYLLGSYSDAGIWEELESLNIEDCVECGCCAYKCPTKNPLVQLIKVGKEGMARQKKRVGALSGASEEE